MDPHDQKPPSVQPYSVTPMTTITGGRPKKSPLKIIFIALGALFVLAVAFAVLFSSKDTKKASAPAPTSSNSSQTVGKAKAIDVENVNNSISQSLGSLSDEKDFPATQLDDKPLGL